MLYEVITVSDIQKNTIRSYSFLFLSSVLQEQGCPPSFPWHTSICSNVQFSGLSLRFLGFVHLQSHI